MRRASALRLAFVVALLAALVGPAAVMIPPALAEEGPGVGNLTYTDAELFQVISRIDTSNGVPSDSPGKPYGLNVVTMHNGYLAILFAPDSGGGPGGLLFYDISNPRAPRLVKRVYEPNAGGRTSEFRESHAIGASNDYPGDYVVLHSGKGLEFWDWSDVENPIQVKKFPLPGVNFGDYGSVAWQLFWQAPYVYVAVANQGIYIVDATDPANPVLVDRGGGRPNPIPPSQLGGFNVGPIFAVGNLLVLTSMETSDRYSTLDISDPKNPVLVGTLPAGGSPFYYATFFNGGKIIASQRGGAARMYVHDITNPATFSLVNSGLAIPDMLYNATQDNFVFQGAQNEVVKVDISNPASYSIVGRGTLGVSNPDHGQVTPIGNLVFVGNDHGTGSGLIAHQKAPDTTGPRVNFVSPANNATSRSLTTRVGVTLTDNVDLRSVNSSTFIVRPLGGQPIAGKYSHQSAIVNFFPSVPLLANTTYEVVIPAGGLKDWAGNAIDQAFTSRFSTGASVSNLFVDAATPAARATGQSASFTATASGGSGGYTYSWSFGDGTPATAFSSNASVSHTYSAPGHYQVSVTARSGTQQAGDAFIQTVHRPLTASKPTSASSIVFDGPGNKVWAVNPDADTVTAINASTYAKLFEVPVGTHPRTLALSGGQVWVANEESDTISVLSAADGALIRTISLPRGSQPFGVAFDPAGANAFVTLQGTGQLLKIRPADGVTIGQVNVTRSPRGLAVSADGARVLVTRFLSPANQGQVVEVNPATMAVARTVPLAFDTNTDRDENGRGLPNYLGAVTISPDGARAWVPSKKDNLARGLARDGQPLTFESTVRTIASQIDLAANSEVLSARIDFNDRDMANAVALSPRGDYAFVALQGSNLVEARDAYTGARAAILFDTGLAPQGVALSDSGNTLYVQNFMSRSVRVYNVQGIVESTTFAPVPLASVATVASEKLPPTVLKGKQIFYTARDERIGRDGYIACASCHTDAGSDAQVWDFTDRGEGLRNTVNLTGRAGTGQGNVHWSGNFDEVQDFENDIRNFFDGAGLMTDAQYNAGTRSNPLGDPKAGVSADLDALAAYLGSLNQGGLSPFRNADGSLTADGQAGRLLFESQGCVTCHAGPQFTDSSYGVLHNVGTGMTRAGAASSVDTPTLKGLWASAPYLHNGAAAGLLDVLTTANPSNQHANVGSLTSAQRSQLVAYLQQIDEIESAQAPSALFTARLNGAQVVPPSAAASSGRAKLVLRSDGVTALVSLQLSGFAAAPTAVHLHGPALAGANAPVIATLPAGSFSNHQLTLTAAQAADLRAGRLYLDVHTAGFANGEVRGQLSAPALAGAPQASPYLSDRDWTSATNAWGPVERDLSNGEQAAGDGRTLTLNGVTYSKGLGVHAASDVRYSLGGVCTSFTAAVGLDDEVGANGSVVFQVYADATKVFDSGAMTGASATQQVNVSVLGASQLRLVVTDGGNGNGNDHADWADAKVTCPGNVTSYVSDRTWTSATNGWGPVELDRSNGETAAGDGRVMVINGRVAAKGLGVHAPADISYAISGCSRFQAEVGLDDEVGVGGSVVFQVYAGASKVYDSGILTGSMAPLPVDVSVAGASTLRLVVTNAGDTNGNDHADWGQARLVCSAAPAPTTVSVNDNTLGTGQNQFEYVGAWSYGSQGGAYQSDNHWSNASGAYYQVDFTGTQVDLYMARAPGHGIAAVSIDGGPETMVDLYAAARADQVLVYTSPTLAAGPHTLRVRVTGTRHASSTGTFVIGDRVDVR